MSKRKTRLVVLLLLTFVPGARCLAQQTAATSTGALLFDPADLSAEGRAQVLYSLASALPLESYESHVVQPGDNLFTIVKDKYKYSDALYPATATKLAELVADKSGLKSINDPLIPGTTLKLPTVPVRAYTTGSSDDTAQIWTLSKGSIAELPTKAAIRASMDHIGGLTGERSPTRSAASLVAPLTPAEYAAFVTRLPSKVRDEIESVGYYGPTSQTTTVQSPTLQYASSATAVVTPSQVLPSSILSSAGKLYVLDFFDEKGGCSHGQEVVDVVTSVLTTYSATSLSQTNVLAVNIGLTSKSASGWDYVNAWVAAQNPKKQKQWKKVIATATEQLNASRPRDIPIALLQAIFSRIVSLPDTSVVSSSFWARTDPFRLVTATELRPDMRAILVTAAPDDFMYIEDNATEDPARTYWDLRNDYAVVVVGGLGSQGTVGAISRDGDGVSCVARAYGWSGRCITPTETGTSFSTPAVATQLFLARAAWAATPASIKGVDVKRRLVLASAVDGAYVGKFQSGGVPQTGWLIAASSDFAVDKDGHAQPVTILPGGSVTTEGPVGPSNLLFGTGPMDIRAIQSVGNEFYVVVGKASVWRRVDIVGLAITYSAVGVSHTIDSVAAFRSQLKELGRP